MFCLRIQELETEKLSVTSIIDTYVNQEQPHMVVRETGEDGKNPHFHFAGQLKDRKTLQSIRTAFNRLGIKGNEAYSLKKGDPEKMDDHFTYLCKGIDIETPPEIVARSPDFDQAIVEKRHEIYWKVNAQLPKKKRKTESVAAAADAIAELCQQRIDHSNVDSLSEDEIIRMAITWTHANRKTLNDFHLKSVINHVTFTLKGFECNRMEQFINKLKYQNF